MKYVALLLWAIAALSFFVAMKLNPTASFDNGSFLYVIFLIIVAIVCAVGGFGIFGVLLFKSL